MSDRHVGTNWLLVRFSCAEFRADPRIARTRTPAFLRPRNNMLGSQGSMLSRAFEWLRWEPYIRTLGAVVNRQFSRSKIRDDRLRVLKNETPAAEAIAPTHYYVPDMQSALCK